MPLKIDRAIHFGTFLVTPQVFHITPHTFCLVNLKPLLPGHVLVCPIRVVPRLSALHPHEVSDLFLTVQRVSRMLEHVYSATSLNIAIQDGADAGQSVPHVHCHIIPRKKADLDDRGGSDAIYGMMEGEEGDVGKHQREQEQSGRPQFPRVDADEDRKPRSKEDMQKEAEWLAGEMEREEQRESGKL